MSVYEYIDDRLACVPQTADMGPYDRRRLTDELAFLVDTIVDAEVEWVPSPYAVSMSWLIAEVDRMEATPDEVDCPDETWRSRLRAACMAASGEVHEAPLQSRLTTVAAVALAWQVELARRARLADAARESKR